MSDGELKKRMVKLFSPPEQLGVQFTDLWVELAKNQQSPIFGLIDSAKKDFEEILTDPPERLRENFFKAFVKWFGDSE